MRYFDKTFFKFTLGFLAIVAISLLIMYAASAYAAGIVKIVFTTDSQTIKPNELSGPITIQTQDSSGNSYQTPETIDLQFISTSGSGEFLGSTGNPVTTYMSKNTANRTFYYRDSTEGNFTVTINAKGRDSGEEWSTNQQITVSSGASQSDTPNSSSLSSSGSQSSGVSTTNASSPGLLLEITAGGDRVTSPGSPILFQATVKKNSVSGASLEFNWSFGDGNIGAGSLVSYSYKYPGDYAVVLSTKAGDVISVSRLKVKVIEPNISVSDKDGYLEISNNGDTEVNIFNWKIEDNGMGFIFQPNTIILPHSTMRLDKKLLNMKIIPGEAGISLKNCLGEKISPNIYPTEKKVAIVQKKVEDTNPTVPKGDPITVQSADDEPVTYEGNSENDQSDRGVAAVIYETPKKEGFFAKIWNFLMGMLH